jgi:hypothetical protein
LPASVITSHTEAERALMRAFDSKDHTRSD